MSKASESGARCCDDAGKVRFRNWPWTVQFLVDFWS